MSGSVYCLMVIDGWLLFWFGMKLFVCCGVVNFVGGVVIFVWGVVIFVGGVVIFVIVMRNGVGC